MIYSQRKTINKFYILAVFAVFLAGNSYAKSPNNFSSNSSQQVSDGDIIKQIEKSLIFDPESREKIDFYSQDNSKKKSEFTLKSGEQEEQKTESTLGILVMDEKISNIDLREKERLAYDAALIDQYEVAIELYKEILDFEPDNNYAKISLAVAYQKIGQFSQAKNLYYELLKTDINDRDLIINNLLNILSVESPRDTSYLLSRLVLQNPKSPTILSSAAMAYERVQNYEKAIELLEKAIILDPSNINYKYNLAIIHDKLSDYEQALQLYAAVIRSSFADESFPVAQIKQRIDFLKSKI